jgi:flagellar biosynthesis/type III secretory pathway M-ring protein FliF/YscJ
MTVEHRKPKSTWRRIERWLVGIAMAMVAFVLEKFVMRAVRKRQEAGEEPEKKKDVPTTLTSKGGKVDL